jgi:hypothetical protein
VDSGDSRREAGIGALVARFVDAVNRRDAEAFRVLWSPEARWELPGRPAAVGVDAIGALLERLGDEAAAHFELEANPVLELHDWPVVGRWWVQEVARGHDGRTVRTIGCYHDTYEEGAEGWSFTERRLEVLFREEDPRSGGSHPA